MLNIFKRPQEQIAENPSKRQVMSETYYRHKDYKGWEITHSIHRNFQTCAIQDIFSGCLYMYKGEEYYAVDVLSGKQPNSFHNELSTTHSMAKVLDAMNTADEKAIEYIDSIEDYGHLLSSKGFIKKERKNGRI
jgi:hypothetical protein